MKIQKLDSWDVKDNVHLRIALFFELTQIDFLEFEKEILKKDFLFSDIYKIKNIIVKSLFLLIDEFFAPFVVKSLVECDSQLKGKTSGQRYASFFLTQNTCWQERALKIKEKFPMHLDLIAQLVLKEMKSYLFFLNALEKDLEKIISKFKISNPLVKSLKLNLSDRHNFMGGGVEVTFLDGKKIIYKAREASSDKIFNKVIEILTLSKKIKTLKVLDCGKYHWAEYIKYQTCKNENELHDFYKNAGILLGVLDALNYTDGHDENFIVSNKRFVLVDTETLFTNLSYFMSRTESYFDLEFTGIIVPKDRKMRYISALQKSNKITFYPYKPYAINDNTDKIYIEYKQFIRYKINKALPDNKKIPIKKFKQDLLDGLLIGYKKVIEHENELIDLFSKDTGKYRQIVRPTLYYIWLIYRFLHPCKKNCEKFLYQKTHNLDSRIAEYEKIFIKHANIPIFYHQLNKKDLLKYDNKTVIENYFDHTPLYWIQKKIKYLSSRENQEKRIIELSEAVDRM